MTIEELYAAARTAELGRAEINSRQLDELHRLDKSGTTKAESKERSRLPFGRLRRSEG